MAELTVDEIKTYCRIDGDADDAEIMKVFLPAAEHYLDAAISTPARSKNATYSDMFPT